mmetsp:Transcript_33346/g.105696  ORF Transcript_33346/g.105696 Transcript_33346/m.105696 type:complete len:235 (-) Transcript_33346:202-906(-)
MTAVWCSPCCFSTAVSLRRDSMAGLILLHWSFQPSTLAPSCASRLVISPRPFCRCDTFTEFASVAWRVSRSSWQSRSRSRRSCSSSAAAFSSFDRSSCSSEPTRARSCFTARPTSPSVRSRFAASECTSCSSLPRPRCSSGSVTALLSDWFCMRCSQPLACSRLCCSCSWSCLQRSRPSKSAFTRSFVRLTRPSRMSLSSALAPSTALLVCSRCVFVSSRRSESSVSCASSDWT